MQDRNYCFFHQLLLPTGPPTHVSLTVLVRTFSYQKVQSNCQLFLSFRGHLVPTMKKNMPTNTVRWECRTNEKEIKYANNIHSPVTLIRTPIHILIYAANHVTAAQRIKCRYRSKSPVNVPIKQQN